MPQGGISFPFDDYSRALFLCSKQTSLRIAAVNMSLDCGCDPTPAERARLDLQIANAHENGASVVAAAGNSGGDVGSPAREPGVFAVAAADATRVLCPVSNRGAGVDALAPGCALDLADPQNGRLWSDYNGGTSSASVTTSVVLALLRSYRADLDWNTAEQLLANSAQPTSQGPALDIEALFRRAGLASLVDAAERRMRSTSQAQTETVVAPETGGSPPASPPSEFSPSRTRTAPRRASAPRVRRLQKRGAHLTVVVRELPRGARLAISLQARVAEFRYATLVQRMRPSRRVGLRLPKTWRRGRVAVHYEGSRKLGMPSFVAYRTVPR
jgi:hypothetical protein